MRMMISARATKGFSLVELLVALLFLSSVMLGILWMTSASARGSMDAYYELLATQLALEPIEVFRSFGYRWVDRYAEHPLPSYPIGAWADIQDPLFGGIRHPPECLVFQRHITITPVPGQPRALQVTVSVAPKHQSRARAWLLKSDITMDSLIFERSQ